MIIYHELNITPSDITSVSIDTKVILDRGTILKIYKKYQLPSNLNILGY